MARAVDETRFPLARSTRETEPGYGAIINLVLKDRHPPSRSFLLLVPLSAQPWRTVPPRVDHAARRAAWVRHNAITPLPKRLQESRSSVLAQLVIEWRAVLKGVSRVQGQFSELTGIHVTNSTRNTAPGNVRSQLSVPSAVRPFESNTRAPHIGCTVLLTSFGEINSW
jgi:hypothetical protein